MGSEKVASAAAAAAADDDDGDGDEDAGVVVAVSSVRGKCPAYTSSLPPHFSAAGRAAVAVADGDLSADAVGTQTSTLQDAYRTTVESDYVQVQSRLRVLMPPVRMHYSASS